jgi:diguanylate cyclase (GGDEF)-like protein
MNASDRLDAASGLFPQQMLETLLAHEVHRSRRYPSPLSILRIAVKFPQETTEGIVDKAQIMIASLLNSKFRESDLPGLFDGDFLVILPATNATGAKDPAERLLEAISGSQPFREAGTLGVSVAMGIASHPGGEGISMPQLLSGASAALIEARKRGRRSIVLFDEIQGKPTEAVC